MSPHQTTASVGLSSSWPQRYSGRHPKIQEIHRSEWKREADGCGLDLPDGGGGRGLTLKALARKGMRREVRRMLAERSRKLLQRYRDEYGAKDPDCPLWRALSLEGEAHRTDGAVSARL